MSTKAGQPHTPAIGETAKDIKSGKLGVVKGNDGPYYQMRPLGGGREWDVNPENIREANPDEILRERVAVANRQSRGELPPELESMKMIKGRQ
jgi:hypothetical protein